MSSLHQKKLKYLENLGEYYVRQNLYMLNNAKPHNLSYGRRSFRSKKSFYKHIWTIFNLAQNTEYQVRFSRKQIDDRGLHGEIIDYLDDLILKHTNFNMYANDSYLMSDKWEEKSLKIISKNEYEELVSKSLTGGDPVWEVKSNNLDRLNMSLLLKKNIKTEEFSFNLVVSYSDISILPYFLMYFSIYNYTHLFKDAYKIVSFVSIFLDMYLSSSAYTLFSISGVKSKFNPYSGKDTDKLLSDDVSLEEFEAAWSEIGFVITYLQISNIFSYLINLIYLCKDNYYYEMIRNSYIHPKISKYKLKDDIEVSGKISGRKKANSRLR